MSAHSPSYSPRSPPRPPRRSSDLSSHTSPPLSVGHLAPPSPSHRGTEMDMADVLDENSRLWKKVAALQERCHELCAENVNLTRQLSQRRARAHATTPLSLIVDFRDATASPTRTFAPSPSSKFSPLAPTPLSATLKTPVSCTAFSPSPSLLVPGSVQAREMKTEVERLQDDNSQLLSRAAENHTTIRQLRHQVEKMARERDRCTCSCGWRERPKVHSHRRSSSMSTSTSTSTSTSVYYSTPGEWEMQKRAPPRRKWDWEERERRYRFERLGPDSPPDLVGGHTRSPSVPSLVE